MQKKNIIEILFISTHTLQKDIGYYTKKYCKTNIDHVVSLKDAFDSGAFNGPWREKRVCKR